MNSDTIKRKPFKVKEWVKQHKTATIVCGVIVVGIGIGVGILAYKRFNIAEPILKVVVPKNAPTTPSISKVDIVETISEASESTREILRSEHIRTLHPGWNVSLDKMAEALEKDIVLNPGETLVDSCAVTLKCA